MKTLFVLGLILGMAFGAAAQQAATTGPRAEESVTTVGIDNPELALAPYVWKTSGSRDTARAEATMPGAYLKLDFIGSTAVGLLVDGTANDGCSQIAMPVIDYSVDHGAFVSKQLSRTGEVYSLPLGDGMEAGKQHHVTVYFRSASLAPDRWTKSTHHLRIAGILLDSGGKLVPTPLRPKRAIAFGDSITEGVNLEGNVPYYSNLLMNNARGTWFPIVCAALDCEYGQLGTGGQGMVTTTLQIPPLPQTWEYYDKDSLRLKNGLLQPEPDYIFCEMGTNDFEEHDKKRHNFDITAGYLAWLAAVRKSAPHAKIFSITPPLGWHASEVQAAVRSRNQAGDRNVFLIDTAPLGDGFKAGEGATTFAEDGVHPTQYGDAILGAFIAVETQKTLH
jgi:lysophospholipase L1-like esterase